MLDVMLKFIIAYFIGLFIISSFYSRLSFNKYLLYPSSESKNQVAESFY